MTEMQVAFCDTSVPGCFQAPAEVPVYGGTLHRQAYRRWPFNRWPCPAWTRKGDAGTQTLPCHWPWGWELAPALGRSAHEHAAPAGPHRVTGVP